MYFSDSDLEEEADRYLAFEPVGRQGRIFHPRQFDEDIPNYVFRERYHVPQSVLDQLDTLMRNQLDPATKRNCSINARKKIKIFLHFLGTNGFYHVMRDCHGVDTHTVFRDVHQVAEALFGYREQFFGWPTDRAMELAQKFFDVAPFPSVCGLIDGTHVNILAQSSDEESYVNRHHDHSINAVIVCGPYLEILYVNANSPGRRSDPWRFSLSVQKLANTTLYRRCCGLEATLQYRPQTNSIKS
ncbi:hypothetical protein TCAL_13144 [Tigriopus californicus]|uniref:DDE Tnp4 domain-containing protein n=1 Tax=Tigriopus californicus TaxID=6832 RepID=A0A553PS83_TIGCA|nr:hypothetical protein TCAL_13144 [Tigriopus californicus]